MASTSSAPRAAGAVRTLRRLAGPIALAVAVAYLAPVLVDAGPALRDLAAALADDPLGLLFAVGAYAAAFGLRTAAWCRVLPGLSPGQSWAALHVSLLGNHVLPLRLGEVLRVTSVLRRTPLPAPPVIASAVTLRGADLLAVLALAALAAPAVLADRAIERWLGVLVVGLLVLCGLGLLWMVRLRSAGALLRLPGPAAVATVVAAWVLEAAVVHQVAAAAGVALGVADAIAVTAVTIVVQAVAVTPGGFGTYEAAATAALVGIGTEPGVAFAVALTTHAIKTCYAIGVGGVALAVPTPSYVGRLRLPRERPPRPPRAAIPPEAPVVVVLPAYQEEEIVGAVVTRIPTSVHGRPTVTIVVDDGSTDATAARAAAAGATVVSHRTHRGLGAALRRGLAEAVPLRPAAVVYLDADGEYFPEDMADVVAPVLARSVDYVVGSRFTGEIQWMQRRRRLGNRVLTAGVRWVARRPDLTDGQSGYRAFSLEAATAAEVVHDYNYAQVLTLDLLSKGFTYTEVPIRYRFRTTGRSFVRLGPYLRRVLPAVYREVNGPGSQSSTTWVANRARAADHAVESTVPPASSASTAS
jgi:uncharacterized membrane protein YbhN (UPF0104 family)